MLTATINFQEKELLTNFIAKVKQNEPGVQVYELDLDRAKSQFLTFEVYLDITLYAHSPRK